MTHKVAPFAHRLGITTAWRSRWISGKRMPQYLREDYWMREFLRERLDRTSTEHIEIERTRSQTTIFIRTSRPGLLIGRAGGGVEKLKQDLVKFVLKKMKGVLISKNIKITVEEVKNPELQAKLVAESIASEIEKRLPFRRVMKGALQRVSANKQVIGVKIALSGRLDGGEMARDESLKQGNIPLQTFRANIDYSSATAHTVQGTVGVKVWIYKGDTFESASSKAQSLT